MVDARRQDEQIALVGANPDPLVLGVAHVKVPGPLEDVADLLVFVHVFVVEGFDLLFVDDWAHGVRGDGDFVAVGVGAAFGEVLHVGGRGGRRGREGVMEYSEGCEMGW